MGIFLIIAAVFGYLNSFIVSIMHIKDKDKLEPVEIDQNAKLTPDEWRSIETEESAKRMAIMSPVFMFMFSFISFVLGLEYFEINTNYGIPGFFITIGVMLILLFVITIGRIIYRIVETQHNILDNVGVYR